VRTDDGAPPDTLYGLLRRGAERWPDRTYLLTPDGVEWNWARCVAEASAAADILAERGVRRGDRVAVFLPNGLDWLRAWWGCVLLDATTASLNPYFRGHLLEDLCDRLAPTAIITAGEFADRLAGPHRRLIVDPAEFAGGRPEIGPLEQPPHPWDTCALLMTSGTTGPSKVSITTNAYLGRFTSWLGDGCGVGPDDRFLADMPLFHLSALSGFVEMMRVGGSVALRTEPAMRDYWRTARDVCGTFAIAPGTVAQFLEAQPASTHDRDHGMRFINCSPLPADPAGFIERFGLLGMSTSYGSTESSCSLVQTLDVPLRPGTCGVRRPGFQTRLVDEHDREVPVGQVGELIVRTDEPWVLSQGYLGDDAATVAAFRNGWFHTGDTMREDADGYFHYHDRRKDCLRRRGENISSFEVERDVRACPGVAEVACVAAPGEYGDDEVKVFLVLEHGVSLEPVELLRFLAERMPHYMVPRYYEITDELPKTPSLRVRKHLLRDRGNGPSTWDATAAGYRVTRNGLIEPGDRHPRADEPRAFGSSTVGR